MGGVLLFALIQCADLVGIASPKILPPVYEEIGASYLERSFPEMILNRRERQLLNRALGIIVTAVDFKKIPLTHEDLSSSLQPLAQSSRIWRPPGFHRPQINVFIVAAQLVHRGKPVWKINSTYQQNGQDLFEFDVALLEPDGVTAVEVKLSVHPESGPMNFQFNRYRKMKEGLLKLPWIVKRVLILATDRLKGADELEQKFKGLEFLLFPVPAY